MSLNLNRVTIAGNLTRTPESRQAGDKTVTSFGLAINNKYKNKAGELVEDVVFLDVDAWGRTGELVAQYLDKGSPAYIEGKLKLEQWTDKEGQKRSKIKVIADNVQFLGGKRDGAQASSANAAAPIRASATSGRDDQVPF